MIIKGMKNMNAFSNLVYTVRKMNEMNKIYENYPKTPKEFDSFKKRVVEEIENTKKRFPTSPL